MTALVEYGRQRGVKVMIEFDIPGHAASWCAGYPDICPSETCLQPLDPSSEITFELIEALHRAGSSEGSISLLTAASGRRRSGLQVLERVSAGAALGEAAGVYKQ